MRCERCGTQVAAEAAYCPRCGSRLSPIRGEVVSRPREEAVLAALRSGMSGHDLACPVCGTVGLRAELADVEEMLFWGVALVLFGLVSLVIVLIGGDVGLFVADLSTIAIAATALGVVLLATGIHRRRPVAYVCAMCGYRTP